MHADNLSGGDAVEQSLAEVHTIQETVIGW